MNPKSCFKKSDVPVKDFEEDSVVLDPQTGCFFLLDDVCRFIWTRLDGLTPLSELAKHVSEAFEVDPSRALKDLEEFVQELLDHNLISPSSGEDQAVRSGDESPLQ